MMGAVYWTFWTVLGLFFTAILYGSEAGHWSWLALIACWIAGGAIIRKNERIDNDDN